MTRVALLGGGAPSSRLHGEDSVLDVLRTACAERVSPPVQPGEPMKHRPTTALLALLAAASCTPPGPPVVAPAHSTSAVVSAPPVPSALPEPDLRVDRPAESGPRGETAELKGGAVVIHRPGAAPRTLAAGDLHAAPGDRALHGIWPRHLLFLDDGALLVGAEDGTLTAVDAQGERRFTLGLRGAIQGMARAGGDLAVVTTDHGVMALVTAAGRAKWERQITAERLGPPVVLRAPGGEPKALLANSHRGVFALAPDGKELFTHAAPFVYQGCPRPRWSWGNWTPAPNPSTCFDSQDEPPPPPPLLSVSGEEIKVGPALRFRVDSPHPKIPSLDHVFPLGFTRVLSGDVASILSDGPDAVLALVCHAGRDYGYYAAQLIRDLRHKCKIVRVSASGAVTEVATVPERAAGKGIILSGEKPPTEPPELVIDAMIRGPSDKPWILARRISNATFGCEDGSCGPPGGAGLVLELQGKKVTERKDLLGAFSETTTWRPLTAFSSGSAAFFCWGDTCATREGLSVKLREPGGDGRVEGVALIAGQPWLVQGGEVRRGKGTAFTPVPVPYNAYAAALAGASETDVWADAVQRYGLLHYDGARWAEVPTPPAIGALFARAADDVWSGRMRWDGKAWSLVHGAPDATVVLARSRDDVWMGSPAGLWHGTSPGPQPVGLAAPTSPDEGLAPSVPLALGDPESRYTVELATPALAKAALPAPQEPIWRLDGATAPDTRDLAAAEARAHGLTLWEDTGPHARVRDGAASRPVVGLPSAAWVAVAAASDGGAWFAGGLGPGPSGEGILFHASGPLGASSTARFRASASLLAVASLGAGEAWAVGAAGTIVHVKDGVVTRLSLPSGEWLRAVLATEGSVWMGGDEGTLLHNDGKAWRVVSQPLGGHATFTSIVAAGGALWASGPSGVVKITKRP